MQRNSYLRCFSYISFHLRSFHDARPYNIGKKWHFLVYLVMYFILGMFSRKITATLLSLETSETVETHVDLGTSVLTRH